MPTFLADPSPAVYLILAAVVLVLGGVWFNNRERTSLLAFAGAVALAAIVVLLDRLFDSPREAAVGAVQAMVHAADAKDPDAFAAHIADTFQYQGESGQPVTVTREQIRKSGFWGILRHHNVHVAAWDFDRDDATAVGDNAVEIGFLAKGEADGKPLPMYFRATFTRQADGKMRLSALATFDPMKRTNERKSLPFFP